MGPGAGGAAPLLPFTHRQLTLFEPPPRRLAASDGVPADSVLAAWLEHHLSAWATSRGWSRSTLTRYRRGLRIMLAVQDTPGGPVPASMVQELSGTGLAARLLHGFLTAHGFLEDDRPQTIDLWFTRTTAHLPEPMASQLAHWFTTRLHGRTTVPRSLARSPITVRNHLIFALPVFTRLAATGLSDLTDIPPARLRQELAACELTGSDYTHTASALRAVFTFLHTHQLATRNSSAVVRSAVSLVGRCTGSLGQRMEADRARLAYGPPTWVINGLEAARACRDRAQGRAPPDRGALVGLYLAGLFRGHRFARSACCGYFRTPPVTAAAAMSGGGWTRPGRACDARSGVPA
ncbi:hypothetical protein [Streptomyces sp. NPDC057403]|uniref:hypothetical protein n=1 Tax=Streptomyces sp. NPDC057403 TaxID=3346119 RepID=UPI0036A6CE45